MQECDMPEITPNLWFDTEGKDAAEFYVSVFPNSEITNVSYYGEAGPRPAGEVLTVDFVLDASGSPRSTAAPSSTSTRPCRSSSTAPTRTRSTTTGPSSPRVGGRKASAA